MRSTTSAAPATAAEGAGCLPRLDFVKTPPWGREARSPPSECAATPDPRSLDDGPGRHAAGPVAALVSPSLRRWALVSRGIEMDECSLDGLKVSHGCFADRRRRSVIEGTKRCLQRGRIRIDRFRLWGMDVRFRRRASGAALRKRMTSRNATHHRAVGRLLFYGVSGIVNHSQCASRRGISPGSLLRARTGVRPARIATRISIRTS